MGDLVDSGGNGKENIPDHVFHLHGQAEDIALIWGLGFEVDDDNDPAPQNIPSTEKTPEGTASAEEVVTAEDWQGVCPCKAMNTQNSNPTLEGVSEATIGGLTNLGIFLICLLVSYTKDTILVETNNNIMGKDLTWDKFL